MASAQPHATLSGDLCSGTGKPSASYSIELTSLTSNLPIERTVSNADGKFEFRNVAPGNYSIVVKTGNGDVIGLQDVSSAMANNPIRVQITEPELAKPVTGTVAASTLQHHPPKKAIQEMNAAIKALQAKDSEAADDHLRAAIRIDPEFSEAHTNLGAEYARAKKLELAYAEFEAALKLGPRGAMQYCNLAVVALAMNHPEEAEREVRQALLIDSRYSQANFLLGKILSERPERYDEAVKHLKLAMADIANANVVLAQIYAKTGRKQDAIAALENYEQVNPSANREKVQQMILSLR